MSNYPDNFSAAAFARASRSAPEDAPNHNALEKMQADMLRAIKAAMQEIFDASDFSDHGVCLDMEAVHELGRDMVSDATFAAHEACEAGEW